MKKAILSILVLTMLLALTGITSASQPEEKTFTVTGYTTWYKPEPLPSGHTRFYLTAQGGDETPEDDKFCADFYEFYEVEQCQDLCLELFGKPCGVGRDFPGTFTFDEWGIVDLDLTTLEGSGWGTNHGIMTITTAGDNAGDKVIIRFNGQTDSQTVWGNFTVLGGTGNYADLHGQGKYSGNAGLVFTVTFSGRFHTDPP